MRDWNHLWQDQQKLNRLFRSDPTMDPERVALTKEMALHLVSETDELIRATGTWKPHRRTREHPNRIQILNELVDIHKYWQTLCQLWNFDQDEIIEASVRKSMVVRQRHAEEFVLNLKQPSIIVDIDNVLADFVTPFVAFLKQMNITLRQDPWPQDRIITWADTNLPINLFEDVMATFRLEGHFARLPLMPGAREFLHRMVASGVQIILLTSRPIAQYPNLYTDTVTWLTTHNLPFHFIWWGSSKAYLCLEREMGEHIRFAVDDDERYIRQYADLGMPVYWLTTEHMIANRAYWHQSQITPVTSLDQIPTPLLTTEIRHEQPEQLR